MAGVKEVVKELKTGQKLEDAVFMRADEEALALGMSLAREQCDYPVKVEMRGEQNVAVMTAKKKGS